MPLKLTSSGQPKKHHQNLQTSLFAAVCFLFNWSISYCKLPAECENRFMMVGCPSLGFFLYSNFPTRRAKMLLRVVQPVQSGAPILTSERNRACVKWPNLYWHVNFDSCLRLQSIPEYIRFSGWNPLGLKAACGFTVVCLICLSQTKLPFRRHL